RSFLTKHQRLEAKRPPTALAQSVSGQRDPSCLVEEPLCKLRIVRIRFRKLAAANLAGPSQEIVRRHVVRQIDQLEELAAVGGVGEGAVDGHSVEERMAKVPPESKTGHVRLLMRAETAIAAYIK